MSDWTISDDALKGMLNRRDIRATINPSGRSFLMSAPPLPGHSDGALQTPNSATIVGFDPRPVPILDANQCAASNIASSASCNSSEAQPPINQESPDVEIFDVRPRRVIMIDITTSGDEWSADMLKIFEERKAMIEKRKEENRKKQEEVDKVQKEIEKDEAQLKVFMESLRGI